MSDPVSLYGTSLKPAPLERLRQGDVTVTLQDGALRHLAVGGTEIIRSVAFLARDRDWGTIVPDVGAISRNENGALRLDIPMAFRSSGARLDVTVSIILAADRLRVEAEGRAVGNFETNRAGFTVLHPIEGVAGAPARLTHSAGGVEDGAFPDLIEPWQPFMDIASLEHRANGFVVRTAFSGDIFEMEDQRQWGDASFKTYNRPLALPWPYEIADGETLSQSVEITWEADATAAAPAISKGLKAARFPETALLLTPEDALRLAANREDFDIVSPQRLLCHVDASIAAAGPQIAAFAALQAVLPQPAYDLELICRFDGDRRPAEELAAHAAAMAESGFAPASVFVCPSVDRQSTPPGSEWPPCPPLDEIHAAAAEAFPDVARGGGMASFFPELNRKRPPLEHLDFVTHGLCPIVHAADDISVLETLETVPHIARSARAIIGDRSYRIGPATIAMRQNPYGARTIPNPAGSRVCMADYDPRHFAAFAAAYALGLATALAPYDVAVWTPSALYGPRGIFCDDGTPSPLARVLKALAGCAGQDVLSTRIEGGLARLAIWDGHEFAANLTDRTLDGLPPFGWR
ncbi:hypothetical protein E2A64_14190 [Pseudohoeflea suaedae]|uniref:Uncharacterized protein n=1 Tax=Pseudohoeflea suaedae TaxID=877384 RepID=A0A4R5PIB0_9HYPH|nr:hypothetical protein [Pseudohoeflea suaedae]TDH34882.1 hypothetical protein E2A64_14190 [Pseudohoeflea suaedae]